MAEDWTTDEIAAAIRAYFDILNRELAQEKVVKARVYRQLEEDGVRTAKAFEFKMQNISAVLALNDLPFLHGLAPAKNFQHALEAALLDHLDAHPEQRAALVHYGGLRSLKGKLDALVTTDNLVEEPAPHYVAEPQVPSFDPRWIDYAAREHACRKLGADGELFIVAYEQRKLSQAGRTDLAQAVDHSARTKGDGLGYDIRSFTEHGQELFIEVKTTNFDRNNPFLITANELVFSKKNPLQYRLYRLFEFGRKPRMFILEGSLEEICVLRPTCYRAWPR